jgi:hypothetical protein
VNGITYIVTGGGGAPLGVMEGGPRLRWHTTS